MTDAGTAPESGPVSWCEMCKYADDDPRMLSQWQREHPAFATGSGRAPTPGAATSVEHSEPGEFVVKTRRRRRRKI